MPTTFVQVGHQWLNLDLVTSVEFVPDPRDPTTMIGAKVWYVAGAAHTFNNPADLKALADWLQAHKAP